MKHLKNIQKIWTLIFTITLFLLLTNQPIFAQTNYRLTAGKGTELQVAGTSNVHDWTLTSTAAESQGLFKFNAKDEIVALNNLTFSVFAKSLKSGKASMDSRTYKSLKADEFPTISYQLKSVEISMVQPNKFKIQTKGSVTIAGKTQPITMIVNAAVNADRSITCTGTAPLKLTDYGIEPPSFMLGAMKVGNDLTIKFDLNYNKLPLAK
jgi:polyisoprenoid-binding protein YceI